MNREEYRVQHGFPKSVNPYRQEVLRKLVNDVLRETDDAAERFESFADFCADTGEGRRLRREAERMVEITAEATGHFHSGFKRLHPEIAWRDIYAMRNAISHEYGDIDVKELWETVTLDFPELAAFLREVSIPEAIHPEDY